MNDTAAVWENLVRRGFGDDVQSRATDWAFGFGPALEAMGLDLVRPRANRRFSLLDYGCGRGGLAHFAKHRLRVGSVCGVDISPSAIKFAQCGGTGTDFQLIEDRRPLPYPAASFDGCLLCFVLCTVPTRERQLEILRELRRLLKPGGRLVILGNNLATAGTRFATVQLESGARHAAPGSKVGVRLFRLAESQPYLEFEDYAWPEPHYLRLLGDAGLARVRSLQPGWPEAGRWIEGTLGLARKWFLREVEHPPFTLHIGTRLD